MRTLVIIDVQEHFLNGYAWTADAVEYLDNVRNLASIFVSMGWPIIVVEYAGFGPTHRSIVRLLGDVKNAVIIDKYLNDGFTEIDEYICKHDLPSNLVVCGMFANQCVFETVQSLINSGFYSVDVALCATLSSRSPQRQLQIENYYGDEVGHKRVYDFIQEVHDEAI